MKLVCASVVFAAAMFGLALAVTPSVAQAQDVCFSAPDNYAAGFGPYSVFAADLDGDGDADLAVANPISSDVSVLKNNGNGAFAAAENYAAGLYPVAVFAADLDGDGNLDLAVANGGSANVSVLKNNGDGTFAVVADYPAGINPISIFAGDLDGDGDIDLAVANVLSDNVSVLKNNGNGTFAATVNYAAGVSPLSVFAADLDGDGDLDLAVANANGNNISVFRNSGDGTFGAAVNYAAGDTPNSVFAADLDGDGDLDLAVANANGSSVSVMKNNGHGAFAAPVNYAAGTEPRSVFAADLDGDGDHDLAVANASSGNVSVLQNNGNGTFAAALNYAAIAPYSVVAADMDGDNDADLAAANYGYPGIGTVSVLINCAGPPPPMQLDILPGSCPNILSVGAADIDIRNLRPGPASVAQPVISVAILGTKTLEVARVDPTTLMLAGIKPTGYNFADVSRPVDPRESSCDCTNRGADGFADLVLRFRQDELLAALSPYTDGEARPVTLEGKTKTGVPLSGSDCVTITTQPIRVGFLAGVDERTPSGLGDCRPNPFNAATTITFSLSLDEHVRLEVYNVLGQRVATLVDADLPAGSHEAVWDARGSASGVYFARLNTRGGSQSKKMVVMK